jgi:hypothetical protein
VADRHDQPCATVAVEKIELDGIRPSAAVPPFGMSPEPSSISRAICPSVRGIPPVASLAGESVASLPSVRGIPPVASFAEKSGQPGQDEASHKRVLGVEIDKLQFITTRVKIQALRKAWILANVLMISSKYQ